MTSKQLSLLRDCVRLSATFKYIYTVASCTIVPPYPQPCMRFRYPTLLTHWSARLRSTLLLATSESITRHPLSSVAKPRTEFLEKSKPTTFLPYRSKASIRLHLRARKPSLLILTATYTSWRR